MSRIPTLVLALLALPGAAAQAQGLAVGPGSTVQGDYLRGVGAAAFGIGYLDLSNARANSINTDTAIRWNEYLSNAAKLANHENALIRQGRWGKRQANFEKIQKRIHESPDLRDVSSGDALNALMDELLDPRIGMSTLRVSPVPLSGDTIRRIPFVTSQDLATFSMKRLSVKGEKNWPVGLRGERIARERKAYERAVDDALEQQIEGKLTRATVLKVEETLNELRAMLDRVIEPNAKDKVYMEAKNFLSRLEISKELFKRKTIEQILGEMDKYPCVTVYDLLVFMNKWKLRFGPADVGEERKMYPELYALLVQQREKVTDPNANKPK